MAKYGPDFAPILQALQAYAGQETRQAATRFDASTQLVKTTADVTTLLRERRERDELKQFLTDKKIITPKGEMSALDLMRLQPAQDALQSMVKSLSEIKELTRKNRTRVSAGLLHNETEAGVLNVATEAEGAVEDASNIWRGVAPEGGGGAKPVKKSKASVETKPTTTGGTTTFKGTPLPSWSGSGWNWDKGTWEPSLPESEGNL